MPTVRTLVCATLFNDFQFRNIPLRTLFGNYKIVRTGFRTTIIHNSFIPFLLNVFGCSMPPAAAAAAKPPPRTGLNSS